MKRLVGKTALVTGGGNGLGRGIVEQFAAEGGSIVFLEIEEDWVRRTEQDLSGRGLSIVGIHGDVTNSDHVREAIRRCVSEWGRLDILVNNAGIATSQPSDLVGLPLADWNRVIEVNLTGAFICTAEAAPVMRHSGGGSIINVTSISARAPYPGSGAYSISKAALECLTIQSAVELGSWNIRVNSISPGWFRTHLNEHVYKAPGVLERRSTMIPLGRIGSVGDCANLAVFLASDESNYITGESIETDGGLLASALKHSLELARK